MQLNAYQQMMLEVKTELHHRPELAEKVEHYIEGLEQKKDKAQQQYIETYSRLEKADYELSNLIKTSEHIGNALKLSARENKAMRELLSIWI